TFVNWWALGPVLAFGGACLGVRAEADQPFRRLMIATFAVFLVHSLWAARAVVRRDQTIGVNEAALSPVGMPEEFARGLTLTLWRAVADSFRYQHRDTLSYRASSTPDHHVVLVIDESISAGHMSLNGYRRATTPWLDALVKNGRASNW